MHHNERGNGWKTLESYGSRHIFKKHSSIYVADQPAQTLFLLHSGQVSLQLRSSQGRALTLQVIEPGQLFGHMALVTSANYDSAAEVTRTSEVTALTQSQLQRLMLTQPALPLELLKAIGEYRLTVSRRWEEVAFKSVPARLASLLLHMADSGAASPTRLPRRTHQQLAEMINAYRETVTKVINQFRTARLLDIDRSGITLLNPSRLREISDNSAF